MCKNVSPAQTSSCYYFLAVLVNKYRTEPEPTQKCFSGSSKKCFSSATQVTVHVLFSAHCYVFVSVPVPGPPSVPGPFPGHVPIVLVLFPVLLIFLFLVLYLLLSSFLWPKDYIRISIRNVVSGTSQLAFFCVIIACNLVSIRQCLVQRCKAPNGVV